MGTDTALAVLSDRAAAALRLLHAALRAGHQPAARRDPRGAGHVDGVDASGPKATCSKPTPEACRQIKIEYPILHNDQVAKLRHLPPGSPFRSTTLPLLYNPDEDGPGLERAMAELCRKASQAVAAGYGILILSDRGVDAHACADPEPARDRRRAPSPGARRHAHQVRAAGRDRRRARGASRRAALGYGAGAVNPYLAFETLHDLIRQGLLPGVTHDQAVQRYIKALNKGVLKVMSKMGISTLQSYCGAQIFEAVGLDRALRRQVLHRQRRRASAASA